MNRLITALESQDNFSRYILQMPLHNYQLRPINAVIDSILQQRGLEFLLMFSRQSGKNEGIAHAEAYLLNLLQRVGGNIVHGAIGDGLGRGLDRLEEKLDNPLNRSQWGKRNRPTRRTLGRAAVAFLSSHPQAHARGETAHHGLIIDEMQDQVLSHIESVFDKMRAAADALTRTEALLQARAREAEQKLEHYEEKLVQAVTAAGLINGTIPPPAGESREKWLRQIWANLTRHDALRPITMYLASALTSADRLVLLDRIMSRLLEPDLPVLSYQ